MMRKKLFYFAWRYVVVFLLFLFPVLLNLSSGISEKDSLTTLFLSYFGGPFAYPSLAVVPLFLFLGPNLFLLFVFSDFMREDCIISYVYVFPRVGGKKRWLFRKTLRLLKAVSCAYLILFLLVFLLGVWLGLPVSYPELAKILPGLFLLNIGTIFLFSLIQNFLSLPLGSAAAYFIIAFLYVSSCILSLLLYNDGLHYSLFLFILLPSNQMLLWHEFGLNIDAIPYNPIPKFVVWQSFLVLVLYSLLSYWIFRFLFLRYDMSQLLKEAN